MSIKDNISIVQQQLKQAAIQSGRTPEDIRLIAVSKTKSTELILQALAAGQIAFGENRVQEAIDKWLALKTDYTEVELHLVGSLQRNKVNNAVGLFDVIHTIDRPKLARAVAVEMDKSGHRPQCFIQVNTGEEPQKGGVLPADADAFIGQCLGELSLPVAGLMCIPPLEDEPSLHFALLRAIAKRNGLESLSMGMSGDFEQAIRFGATHVRVGTALFGQRPPFKAA